MAKATPKLILDASRDIPFDKLVLSQTNVRRVKAGVTIPELAEDIFHRKLLQSLSVRIMLDCEGQETGLFEVPVGGRRYRALELLVKQKRFAKDGPVPCIVKGAKEPISGEEDSLAENTFREPLHPLDEFRGMQTLAEQGLGEEEIAVRFNTTATVVKQRLRLASVSPKLHEVYAEDGMTLEQLIAFSVNEDHARQEEVWALLAHSWNKSPPFIRQKLTETTAQAGDRRVRFVGIDAYVAAGGAVMRDLFEDDHGGWLSDVALLDRLVAEKLKAEGERVQAEGWAWVVTAASLPYGFDHGLRELDAAQTPLTAEQEARIEALIEEQEALELEHEGADELPEAVEARLEEIEQELAALSERPWAYDSAEMARAGAFVSFSGDGALHVDRGFVRPEDELPEAPDPETDPEADADGMGSANADGSAIPAAVTPATLSTGEAPDDEAEEDLLKPLPDRLVTELTTQRTLALQDAFAAVLHALVLSAFYPTSQESCLGLSISRLTFYHQPADLRESPSAKAIEARHAVWAERLPTSDKDLWAALQGLDGDEQAALFAHCAAYAVNAVWEPVPRYDGRISARAVDRRVAHADILAAAVGLDMAEGGWRPTVVNFLGRVTKAHILKAVNEGQGAEAAGRIDHLRKDDMAREAERLLADAGWLPEPLRTPVAAAEPGSPGEAEPIGEEPPASIEADEGVSAEVEPAAALVAAE